MVSISKASAEGEATPQTVEAYALAIHQAICDRLIDAEWGLLERGLADISRTLADHKEGKPWPDQRVANTLIAQWNAVLARAHRLRMLRVDVAPIASMESQLTATLATIWNEHVDRSLGLAIALIAATFVGSEQTLDNAKIVTA